MVITMKVAMLGFSAVKLLETLAGSWISILTMRRRMFCLLDIVFEPLAIADGGKVVALSPALQDELCTLCSLSCLQWPIYVRTFYLWSLPLMHHVMLWLQYEPLCLRGW